MDANEFCVLCGEVLGDEPEDVCYECIELLVAAQGE